MFFILAFVILANCASLGASDQMQVSDMIDELAGIAADGLLCLESNFVDDLVVSYDVIETDSLITPILGIINVETKEILITSGDGTPQLTFRHHFKLTFAYEEGRWTPLDLEVIYGRPPPDKDIVSVCFQ
jgi:hypothetical protein